jgi:ubiquitin carboxyl-terminal hydrolase MINDY-1/2
MDLNPLFSSCTAFRPATTGGELALFASAGISLVHGWLVDPASPEHAAVSRVEDYDSAVNLIVEADVLTRGLLVGADADRDDADDAGPSEAGPSHSNVDLTDEERRKVEDGEYPLEPRHSVDIVLMRQSQAFAIRMFLDNTRSQLTYHGLFTLASLPAQTASISEPTSSPSLDSAATETTPPPHPELFALFRNSHLAVLYRHAGALYTLVTDQVFLNEPSVVWERLEDVDQGAATFVGSTFERAAPVGGDWAGFTLSPEALGTVDPSEYVLVPSYTVQFS